MQIAGEGPSTSKKQTLASKLVKQVGSQKGSGEILAKYQWHSHVFSEEAVQCFPESQIWDHAIELKPNAPSTIPGKVYQLTQDEQKALLDFVKEQQVKGYICPSKSPNVAPFFFIKKKDGKLWPIQDYQRLNEWTIKNCYPLPLIFELIAWVQNAKIFTKVDVRWGYNNIHIKEGDEYKAAFITSQGLFRPSVMFFGLTNSPATFQMMMNAIFAPEIAEGWLIIYMDNILIATRDNLKFHEECVHCILEKLCLHDLYLELEKCIFKQQWMEFLEVVLENGTVQMDPAKLKGIANWPQPQCVTDVHTFLGFTGFYHYFVPNYSNIAWPLIQLTKKNAVFKWMEECKIAFEQLKTLICTHPMTTGLHQSILPHHRCLSLWHGHHTLTGGRNQPLHSKTHALPCHLLLSHLYSHTAQLWYLWMRISRGTHAAHEIQTPPSSDRNPSYYPHWSC